VEEVKMLKSLFAITMLLLLMFTSLHSADRAGDDVSPENKTVVNPDVDQMLAATRAALTGEEINWQVVSSGGTEGSSASFKLMGTVGQTAVGAGSSASYGLNHGYWQDFVTDNGCCLGEIRGNVDYDPGDNIDISDLVYLVDYMFTGGPPPPCFEEADMNCDGSIDISDLVWLVDYMFTGGPPPCRCDCADCP
jgi:hypothetical protein